MRTAPLIHNRWNVGGPFIGPDGKPNTVVTIQSPYTGDVLHTVDAGNYGDRGEPVRWYQALANDQAEVIVPNVAHVQIDRSIDQDAGTCTVVVNNQQMYTNTGSPAGTRELGQPGFFTANRGRSRDAVARWGYGENDWVDAFVPDALLRTYQGYGGHDKTISEAIFDGNLILTGVWLVDEVIADSTAKLQIKCRDMAKLLIEQQLYPPLVPVDHYPLKYYRWKYFTDAIRAGSRSQTTSSGTATAGARLVSYSDSSGDHWYGYNFELHGHFPTDSLDGNPDTYWLSVGNSYADAPWATDWIEYNVGSDINAITVNPWAGNYQMFVSVMVDGSWVGDETVPYDPSYLFTSQSPAVDTGAAIPFVAQYGVPWETEQTYFLPALYHADRVRISFRHAVYTEFGPWHFRFGVREFGASVDTNGANAVSSSTVTYTPLFLAADAAANQIGYVTSDGFADVDVFGDARSHPYTGGAAYVNTDIITGVTVTHTGLGYYLLSSAGRVYCYGDAIYYGDPVRDDGFVNSVGGFGNCTDLALTPNGLGYWIADTHGYVFAFGNATNYGNFPLVTDNSGSQYNGIEAGPTTGLWGLRSDGVVLTLGSITSLGSWNQNLIPLDTSGTGLVSVNQAICIRSNTAGTGYWILSQTGQVQAFGTAVDHGGVDSPAASLDWGQKYWDFMPAADGGYLLLRGDGTIVPIATDYYFGAPIPGGTATLRTDGNYLDYADIIRDLALWSGFYLYDPDLASNAPPPVYGNIESTGAYAPEPLPDDLFDKKPVIDAMHQLKETVGYLLWVDDQGGFRFEAPNWWGPGNFNELGEHLDYLPEVDERVQLTDYSVRLSDQDLRSVIIISSEDPDADFSSTITTRFVPADAPTLRGLVKPAMWINGFFQNPDEQKIMAELIALHIHFSGRQGQVRCAANPAIQVNDQIRIWERQAGESYVHYIRGVSTTHDLESGAYTMTLTTNWLGDETEWAISAEGESSIGTFALSELTTQFILSSPAVSTSRLRPPNSTIFTASGPDDAGNFAASGVPL